MARQQKQDPVEAIADQEAGRVLITAGKIVDLQRDTIGGFNKGMAKISQMRGATVCVRFQNENLLVQEVEGKILATTPDLICIVDSETGGNIATEEVYGVVGLGF